MVAQLMLIFNLVLEILQNESLIKKQFIINSLLATVKIHTKILQYAIDHLDNKNIAAIELTPQ